MKTAIRLCAGLACAAASLALLAAPAAPVAQDDPRGARSDDRELPAVAAMFRIDQTHSMALFRVRHLGAGAFWGRFNSISGSIEHDAKSDSGLRLDVTIAIDSVDTGAEDLDGHLKSPDFFNAAEFENMTFKSTSAKKVAEGQYEVTGDLTMHGVTRPITTSVAWLGTAAGRMGERCGFETTFTVKRSEFGMDYGVDQGVLGDETRIVVALEGVKQSPQAEGGRGGDRGNLMARLDQNGDGKLQKDELPERMQERFDDLDANGDGAIDADELQAIRGRHGGGDR